MGHSWCYRPFSTAAWGIEAGGFQVQGLFGLQSGFKTSLVNLEKLCLKVRIDNKLTQEGRGGNLVLA